MGAFMMSVNRETNNTLQQDTARNLFQVFFSKFGLALILILLMVFFGTLNFKFLRVDNLFNIIRQVSIYAIMGAGMTAVLLCGHIDLSVGSVVALTGVFAAYTVKATGSTLLAILVGIVVGTLVGLCNGLLTVRFNVPSLLITLGTQNAIRGIGYLITDGRPVWDLPETFGKLGGGYFLKIPIPVYIVAIVYILMWIYLTKTKYGRYIYSTGGNREAAALCGINTKKTIVTALCISGLLAGLSGVIWASRLMSGQPIVGTGYEMQAIAAAVIGGVSLAGGQGEVTRALLGALLLGVLYNGLNLLRVSPYWQLVGTGLIIILAVILDSIRNVNKN
jgi:ribose/xylose/arabinose/galactoside ABC-type transport system permease subunit